MLREVVRLSLIFFVPTPTILKKIVNNEALFTRYPRLLNQAIPLFCCLSRLRKYSLLFIPFKLRSIEVKIYFRTIRITFFSMHTNLRASISHTLSSPSRRVVTKAYRLESPISKPLYLSETIRKEPESLL